MRCQIRVKALGLITRAAVGADGERTARMLLFCFPVHAWYLVLPSSVSVAFGNRIQSDPCKLFFAWRRAAECSASVQPG